MQIHNRETWEGPPPRVALPYKTVEVQCTGGPGNEDIVELRNRYRQQKRDIPAHFVINNLNVFEVAGSIEKRQYSLIADRHPTSLHILVMGDYGDFPWSSDTQGSLVALIRELWRRRHIHEHCALSLAADLFRYGGVLQEALTFIDQVREVEAVR